jgi:hypothetical protein
MTPPKFAAPTSRSVRAPGPLLVTVPVPVRVLTVVFPPVMSSAAPEAIDVPASMSSSRLPAAALPIRRVPPSMLICEAVL